MSVAVKEIRLLLASMGPALPTHLFLFPDDLNQQTQSAGAAIRDRSPHHNAIGIPLFHFSQTENPLALFDDDDFEDITNQLTQRFQEINNAVWKPDSTYRYVAVPTDRKLEGLDSMKDYAPRVHAFIAREWTALLNAVDQGQPSDEYRASPCFPSMEIRAPPTPEGEEENQGTIGEYKDGVFYLRNFKGKNKEKRMLDASRRIHSTDLDEVLKRHAVEWGSYPRATFEDTKNLLQRQHREILATPIFRGSAMDNQIVGWIGTITAPILLIRKFPSYYAVRVPRQSNGIHGGIFDRSGYISVGGMGICERPDQKRAHEEDLVTELHLRGLPQGIPVCVAFIVPYRPAQTEWEYQPPPAEVTKFTPYLKFLMASMRNLKYIVVMDQWSAQFVINAKLNYNAMKYTDSTDPPEYGVPTERPINFYPVPSKRTLKASAYAVFLPHPFQYTAPSKDEHTKRRNKAAFEAGVRAINQVVKPSGTVVDGFSILMRPSKRIRSGDAEKEEEEKEEPKEDENEEATEEEVLPVTYDDSYWAVRPFRVRKKCACVSCGGCGWKKPLVMKRVGEDEGEEDGPDDLGSLDAQEGAIVLCDYCFCRHHNVHRDLDWNECPSGCVDLVPKSL
jgi:hypothetical protein